MSWWADRLKKSKPEPVTSKTVPLLTETPGVVPQAATTGLAEKATMELMRIGELQSLKAGMELPTLIAAQSPSTLSILINSALRLNLAGSEQSIMLDDRYLLLSPRVVAACHQAEVRIASAGQCVMLNETQQADLSENARAVLSVLEMETLSRLNAELVGLSLRLAQRDTALTTALSQQASQRATDFVASDLVQSIVKRIPRLPLSTSELLAALTADDSSASRVTDLVSQDPALTSLLLKVINSSQYSFEAPITDVSRVIVLLGHEGVYQMIMSGTLKKSLPDTDLFRRSYNKSIELAQIAYAVARCSAMASPAELSTLALLSDVGLLVAELLKRQNPQFRELIEQVDTVEFGAELLKSWGLPERLWRTIRIKNDPKLLAPERIDTDLLKPLAVLYIAEQLHSRQFNGSDQAAEIFVSDYLALLGWREKTLETVWNSNILPSLRSRRNCLPQSLRRL